MQQQNSFSLGCNYSNRNSITGWSLWPVQDIDTRLLNNMHFMNPYANVDLYLRQQLKDTLKHTMLVQESVFESQVHELHRLYQRQKELMIETERAQHHEEALYFDSSLHWMIPSVSTLQTSSSNYPYEAVHNIEKTQKKLELPVFGYNDRVEEKGSNFLKEQSMEIESSEQLNKLHFDLNEPADEIGEDSAKEYLIDLNMPPLSSVEEEEEEEEEEIAIVNKVENEKPLSVLEQRRVLVQALPCLDSVLLLEKQYKPGRRKKLKSGPSSNKPLKGGSNLNLHLSQGKKKPCCRPSNGNKVVVGKKKRKKSRKISLVTTEGNTRETYAVEAILDMSKKSGEETSGGKGLLWLAEISSLVVADDDSFEAVTLQVTEMELNEQNRKTLSVSNIVHGKKRRSRARQVKRKFIYDQDSSDDPSLANFPESVANEDQQVIGMLLEPSESKRRFLKKDGKSSLGSPATTVEEEMGIDWAAITKRKRGSRIPAASFQHLIINQLV